MKSLCTRIRKKKIWPVVLKTGKEVHSSVNHIEYFFRQEGDRLNTLYIISLLIAKTGKPHTIRQHFISIIRKLVNFQLNCMSSLNQQWSIVIVINDVFQKLGKTPSKNYCWKENCPQYYVSASSDDRALQMLQDELEQEVRIFGHLYLENLSRSILTIFSRVIQYERSKFDNSKMKT